MKVYAQDLGYKLTIKAMNYADNTWPLPGRFWTLHAHEVDEIKETKTYAAYINSIKSQLINVGEGFWSTPEMNVNFKTLDGKTDPYYAFGDVRFRSEGCVRKDGASITYYADIFLSDFYTFLVPGYGSLPWYTPTKYGYNLESHGWLKAFSVFGVWPETIRVP